MTRRTTLYLPDDLKAAVEREARHQGRSEADIMRAAIDAAVRRPRPKPGIFSATPFADRVDELLADFGDSNPGTC